LIFMIGAEWGLAWSEPSTPHPPHALSALSHGESAVVVDHPHLEDGSIPAPQDMFTAALPPRIATMLIALGVFAVAVAMLASLAQRVAPTVRGPPRGFHLASTGQDILTRFCIVRR
jgi:lipoprotein LpqS